jgi:hypothetical protein
MLQLLQALPQKKLAPRLACCSANSLLQVLHKAGAKLQGYPTIHKV